MDQHWNDPWDTSIQRNPAYSGSDHSKCSGVDTHQYLY
ncbi:hypothetical protein EE612_050220 [Oryza sativa]|nr:hypothetical protein EE612_050220 [Oryza sativa]